MKNASGALMIVFMSGFWENASNLESEDLLSEQILVISFQPPVIPTDLQRKASYLRHRSKTAFAFFSGRSVHAYALDRAPSVWV